MCGVSAVPVELVDGRVFRDRGEYCTTGGDATAQTRSVSAGVYTVDKSHDSAAPPSQTSGCTQSVIRPPGGKQVECREFCRWNHRPVK